MRNLTFDSFVLSVRAGTFAIRDCPTVPILLDDLTTAVVSASDDRLNEMSVEVFLFRDVDSLWERSLMFCGDRRLNGVKLRCSVETVHLFN